MKQLYEGCSLLNNTIRTFCLSADEVPSNMDLRQTFDIDSITGFPASLEFFKRGFHFNSYTNSVKNLSANIHLTHQIRVERRHRTVELHKIPHFHLGRASGFEALDIFLFFPQLYYDKRPTNILRESDLELFFDRVWLKALFKVMPNHYTQHLGYHSYQGAKNRSVAQAHENPSIRLNQNIARAQYFTTHIESKYVARLWRLMQDYLIEADI